MSGITGHHRRNAQFKEKLAQEMNSPNGRTVSEVYRDTGISEPTLYKWKNKYREEGEVIDANRLEPENWKGEDKLAVVIETAGLNEQELSEYCREEGLYVEHNAPCMMNFSISNLKNNTEVVGREVSRNSGKSYPQALLPGGTLEINNEILNTTGCSKLTCSSMESKNEEITVDTL